MGEIAAHAARDCETLPKQLRPGPRVFVAKGDAPMHIVADGLDAAPASGVLPNSDQAISDRRSVSQ